MGRRDFTRHLLGAAAGMTGVAAPWSALARTPTPAARSIPWQRAFEGLQADVPRRAMALRGRVPAALAGGVLLHNGPARHQLGDVRYSH
ncbi:MAG: carotenoid oxygenase, partial [Ottowia sp.]|nr:carotenoid oxygenase [Ottowia sp.]